MRNPVSKMLANVLEDNIHLLHRPTTYVHAHIHMCTFTHTYTYTHMQKTNHARQGIEAEGSIGNLADRGLGSLEGLKLYPSSCC